MSVDTRTSQCQHCCSHLDLVTDKSSWLAKWQALLNFILIISTAAHLCMCLCVCPVQNIILGVLSKAYLVQKSNFKKKKEKEVYLTQEKCAVSNSFQSEAHLVQEIWN